jgi:hypothetical protein
MIWTMSERLKLISGEEPIALGPTGGQETLAQASEVFRYIDCNFDRTNLCLVRHSR